MRQTRTHLGDGSDDNDSQSGGGRSTRRTFVKGAGASALALGIGSAVVGSASAAGIPTPWLERDGNLLRDQSGNKVILRGVNTVDPWRAARDAPYYKLRCETQLEMTVDEDLGWYSRVFRVPMQPNDIAREGAGSVAPVAFTQAQLDSYIADYVDPIVETAAQVGSYVILDYHRHWPDGPDWNDPALDEEIRMFWETVAPRYSDASHVLYEVFNEPTTPYAGHDCYECGPDVTDPESEQTWLDWRETAQPWVDLIRQHAPRNVILIGSPRWSQWTYWAPQHEFSGDNLAYVGHAYTQEGLRPLSTYFGEPSEEVPVFMSEFGWGGSEPHMTGDTATHGPEFAELYDNYDMHWQAWCFDFDWNPAMLNRDYEVTEGWGQWVKDRLAAHATADVPSGEGGDWTPPDSTPGNEPTPTPTDGATPTPTPVGECPEGTDAPAQVGGAYPQDLNGDGLHRDVNGNCRLDSDDVVTYFENMEDPAITNNVGAYDYNANDRIDFDDLVTLFESL